MERNLLFEVFAADSTFRENTKETDSNVKEEGNQSVKRIEASKDEPKQEQNKEVPEPEEDAPPSVTVITIVEQAMSIIIAFFSSTFLFMLTIESHTVEVFIVVMLAYAIWLTTTDHFIIPILSNLWTLRVNTKWHSVLSSLCDFITRVGLFLIMNFFLYFVNVVSRSHNFTLMEALTSIIVVLVMILSLYHTGKSLYMSLKRI